MKTGRRGRVLRIMRRTLQEWLDDDAIRWSAAIAYYSVVSLAPLVVLAVTALSAVMDNGEAQRWVMQQVATLGGPQAAEVTGTVLRGMPPLQLSSLGSLVTILLLVFGATVVFANLQKALNHVWEVEPRDGIVLGLVRTRVAAFTTVLAFGAAMLVSVILGGILGWLGPLVRVLDSILPYITVAELVSSLLVLWLTVGAVFWVLPDVRVGWRDVWIGALVTAALLVAGKHGLSTFLARKATASLYGTAGSIFLLLLWVYYSGLVFFLGAEFTQVWAEERHREIVPDEHAVRTGVNARSTTPDDDG